MSIQSCIAGKMHADRVDDEACYQIYLKDLAVEKKLEQETGRTMHSHISHYETIPTLETVPIVVKGDIKESKRVSELRARVRRIMNVIRQGDYMEDGRWVCCKHPLRSTTSTTTPTTTPL